MPSPMPSNSNPPAAAPARRRFGDSRRWLPYLFISPFFILFGVFGLFPLLFSVWMSLHTWDPAAGLAAMQWVGLENYTHTLFNDDWFQRSMGNTVWIALLSGVPQHLVALPLAWFLHTQLGRWRNAVLGLYFLPFITSTVAITLVFGALFSREFGVVNQALGALHTVPVLGALFPATPVDWTRPEHLPTMISAVVFWRYVGWNVVLYLSAMQTIPKDLLEAAAMDGAGPVRRFVHIVLPMLRPMIFFAVTLTIIGNLQLFEEPFILTSGTGGTDQAGKTAAMHLYAVAFSEGDFGTASAIAWLLFLLVAGGTWLNRRLLGRET
ncbi:cytochrome C biogenesis protein [beta proteobacterium AAP121]|nr:cytochrome C biogenesis protein [beta proteobacterium AAP65]KPF99043.1 cytochrome C biogenesis protein [beta proteobacterium AAP121]